MNITFDELSKNTGISKTTLHRFEMGEQNPTIDKIDIIAKALNTTTPKLCGWETNINDDGSHGFNLETLAVRLKNNDFDAIVCATKEEATNYIIRECGLKSIGLGSLVGFEEMGLIEKFKSGNIKFSFACEIPKDREEERKGINSSVFILSPTGISYQSAEMVIISSNGRSIAGSLSGADTVIFVIGKNKISQTLTSAIERTKNEYISKLAKAGNYRTPCATTGKCKSEECRLNDCRCKVCCIYNRAVGLNKVILVNEKIGY